MCDALIELAHKNDGYHRQGSVITFSQDLKISKLKNLDAVLLPSLRLDYRKNCNYDDIVGIRNFDNNYQLVGGVNLPKKVTCVGTDGVMRTLLVKGKDDLRQDAVMQQVFTIMNSLLYQDIETNSRKLVIRTYKVLPLSQRSGVIEWCDNTQPLSTYLIGNDCASGAHRKFNPEDPPALECRARIRVSSIILLLTHMLSFWELRNLFQRTISH